MQLDIDIKLFRHICIIFEIDLKVNQCWL